MKLSFLCVFIWIACALNSFGQKPSLDSSVFGRWPVVVNGAISGNGKYTSYTVQNQPVGSNTLYVKRVDTNLSIAIAGAAISSAQFTSDSKRLLFNKEGDSLGILTLENGKMEYMPGVASFQLIKMGSGDWVLYNIKHIESGYFALDIGSGRTKYFEDVKDFVYCEQSGILLLQLRTEDGNGTKLEWYDLQTKDSSIIWHGGKSGNYTFDAAGSQLAFTAEDPANDRATEVVWYYKPGYKAAEILTGPGLQLPETSWKMESIGEFSRDGNSLFLKFIQERRLLKIPGAVQVNIWSYKDTKLQSRQLSEIAPEEAGIKRTQVNAEIRLKDRQIILVGDQDDNVLSVSPPGKDREGIALMGRNLKGDFSENNWNAASRPQFYLVSLRNGEKLINKGKAQTFEGNASLSPAGKYVLYYDTKRKNYFSYQIQEGILRNITQSIKTSWTSYGNDHPDAVMAVYNLAGWLKEDEACLLSDQNDVWLVDPGGKRLPVNLTNGYGRRNNIVFRLVACNNLLAIDAKENLFFTAFNRGNKENGFYRKEMGQSGDPIPLSMGPFVYYIPEENVPYPGDAPVKAENAKVFLVKRASSTESPNYFVTSDFKTFTRISDLHPEKEFNWLTTELINWRTPDGRLSQGVLYKPENFNNKHQYSLILYYYETLSNGLNEYLVPDISHGPINIPWYVSKGYLVFSPDIHYKIGHPGESAFASITSAARYLAKFPFIDSKRIGIQGHSFGGYETNYVVSHTDMFAAAMSAAGLSDFISHYGGIFDRDGAGKESMYELGQCRMGITLWARPDLYIGNSPVFSAARVNTPLLMMNNKQDGAVDFSQGLEFFTALRRLHKKAWMLQYDGEGHTIGDRNAALDYTIRVGQFFDYYLQGRPAPGWMLGGIPAKLKGVDSGLKLNNNGEIP